jgi:capsular exopolysaccharide synthesis family protein
VVTINEYRRVFRERWLAIFLTVLLGMGAGAGMHYLRPSKYTASLQMYVTTRAVDPEQAVFEGEGVPERRVTSYVELASSERVTSTVIRQLGLDTSPGELASRITAASSTESVVIDLFVVDSSPQQAATIANATATTLAGLVDELEKSMTLDGASPVIVKTVQPAEVPTTPTGRGLPQWLVLGMLVGIAAGVVLALARNAMDNTVKSLEQLRELSGVPNLGVIAYDSHTQKRPLVMHDDPSSARAEAFRQLRTNVQFVDVGNQHKVLTFTSAMSGEGKTTTVVNLAIALGSAGGSVLVIEADLRRPKVAEILGLDKSIGLTSVIAGRLGVQQAIQSWQQGSIDLLASGPLPPNPSELLASPRMQAILDEVRGRYDVILVDTPPLVPVTDAAAIAPATDGAILLCRFQHTTKPQLAAAVQALRAVGAPLLGSVFTMVSSSGASDFLPQYSAKTYAASSTNAVSPPVARSRVQAKNGTRPGPMPTSGADLVMRAGRVPLDESARREPPPEPRRPLPAQQGRGAPAARHQYNNHHR